MPTGSASSTGLAVAEKAHHRQKLDVQVAQGACAALPLAIHLRAAILQQLSCQSS